MTAFSSYDATTERLPTSFELECALGLKAREDAAAALSRAASRPPPAPAPARVITVLLIEDSPHIHNLVRLLLAGRYPDAQLCICTDGDAGLLQYVHHKPDLLLVDIMLPGIDGALLVASLRSEADFDVRRLIVMTSLDEDAREPYAWALDGLPVISKHNLVKALPALLDSALNTPRQALA